ncbi:Two-component system sensor protein [uncultured Stenotrophomonas sp.]|uniref:Sensory/regulatory protein RpfC n=1 Tax=uncultured Stenotrophomonas sp. TaxID=165438 RepID=A0A1Y5Q7W8_9GAMM|nr:Two-component system sensor protein [uncultured Stenotrophomonas sp.]
MNTPAGGRWALGATLLAVAAAVLPWLPGPALPPLAAAAAVGAALCALLSLQAAHHQARATDEQARRARDAEHELQRLRQEQQRHNQLEQQLLQAKQDAEAAMLAKGEFLATMSHEIRTPLNGIIPMLEMVAQGPLATEQRQMLDTASESAHALFRIVDDILDYSKLEAQRLELEITTFNLRELLDSMLQLMRRSAEHKGLDIALHLDPAVRLAVRGDPVRLRQVLSNLLVNAIKFTEHGGVQVHVRRLGETPVQHRLRFEVRDTGIGIDSARQERLFSAFTQADASTTRLYGGTGLGLAICKRIIDLMNGSIGLSSMPGQGSTFWFEIPLLKVVGDLRQPGQAHGQRPLLLVTRESRLRQRLQLLLPNWGFQPRAVETVQEALDLLRDGTTRWHGVIGDLESLPHGATALQRAIQRDNNRDGVQLVWLHGEAPVPVELYAGATVLPRQCPDDELRAALASTVSSAPTTAAPSAEPASNWSPTGIRVLLVEDNPVNLLVAQKLLAAIGCQSDAAANGELALEKMHSQAYAAVLMDCQMPVLDGYGATRRWREHETATGTPRLPIIAMTANAMAGDRQRCLDAGMDDYLSKPIVRDNLQACLQRWCQGRATPPPDSTTTPAPAPTPMQAAAPAPAEENARAAPPPILDREILDELREIAGNETATIIDVFLDDSTPLVRRLQEAAVAPDLEQLRELAHSLKSASANVGALALSAAARRVELAARTGMLDRPAVMVALIIAEFARARLALVGYQAQMRAGAGARD